jgi:hypothetical protein
MKEGGDCGPKGRDRRLGVEERVVARDHDALVRNLILEEDDGEVVVGIVVVGSWFAGETHASQRPKLRLDAGFNGVMQVYEILRDVETLHFLHLKENCLTMLGLVKGGIIVGEVDGVGEVFLAPLGQLKGRVTGMDVDVGGAVVVVKVTLVLLDRAESKDDGVVHKGEGLASFPGSEDGALIHFVLGLSKNADDRVAPIRV